jgi:hypothetical protein
MGFSERKLNVINQLMQVGDHSTLKQVEEILIRDQMEAEIQESVQNIEKGEVVSLEEFKKRNQNWLKRRATA